MEGSAPRILAITSSKHYSAPLFACQEAPLWESMQQLLGSKLRYLRSRESMTQAELARQISAKRSHINNVEASRRAPSLNVVLQIANLFSVTTDYLLRDTIAVEDMAFSTLCKQSVGENLARLLGSKLQHLRVQRSLSQSSLADQLQLAANAHISYLETGRKDPSLDLVIAIADLFGVTTDYLLCDSIDVVDDNPNSRVSDAPEA